MWLQDIYNTVKKDLTKKWCIQTGEKAPVLKEGHQEKFPREAGHFAVSSWIQMSCSCLSGNCFGQIITGLSLGIPGETLTQGESGLNQI